MFFDGGYMGFGMWFFWIVLVVLAVVFIKAFSSDSSEGSSTPKQERPLDVLKARYARGEIDEEEFNRRKRTLEES